MPIVAGGRTIKLGDFTTVTRGFEDPPTYTVRHNGQQVLMLGIVMTDDGNIVDLGKALEKEVAKDPVGASLRRRARARRRPADHGRGGGVGVRALAHGGARDRPRRVPAQPRLAHRHRRRARRADRAGRGGRS